MVGSQEPSVNDTDTLFMEGVKNAATAAHILKVYGPHIDVWPSGVRTLGFGEGQEGAPAAAMALAAVGAIAVRASAGESDAARAYTAHRAHIDLTLRSNTMDSALRSMRQGEGAVATLAIAANMTDRYSELNVADTLMTGPSLSNLLGEAAQNGNGRSSVNALHFTDSSSVVDQAKEAQTAYVSKFFNASVPEEHLPLYTYAALALRTGALNNPNTPSARLWLGAIVEAGDAIAARLPQNVELQHALHPDCYAVYRGAIDRGLTERPSGLVVGGVVSNAIPERRRTVGEASRASTSQAIAVKTKSTAVVQRTPAAVVDTSYTGRRAAAEMGSNNLRYLDMLNQGLKKFIDCQKSVQESIRRQQETRANVHAALTGMTEDGRYIVDEHRRRMPHIYGRYPYLQPDNLHSIDQAERDLAYLIEVGDISYVTTDAMDRARDQAPGPQKLADLGIDVAAASILRMGSPESQKKYQELIAQPVVRDIAATQLERNMQLLLVQGVEQLLPETLARYGLRPGDASRYSPSAVYELPKSPLHVLVMAADVVNANNSSVLPLGKQVRLRGPSAEELRASRGYFNDPSRNRYARPSRQQLRREDQEQAAASYAQQLERVENITTNLQAFLQKRYGVPVGKDTPLLGFLAECAIAEDMDFFRLPPVTQSHIAWRLYQAAGHNNDQRRSIDPQTLPAKLRPIYDHAMTIIKEQSGNRQGSVLSRWFNTLLDPQE